MQRICVFFMIYSKKYTLPYLFLFCLFEQNEKLQFCMLKSHKMLNFKVLVYSMRLEKQKNVQKNKKI
jgi:hypothetical protein